MLKEYYILGLEINIFDEWAVFEFGPFESNKIAQSYLPMITKNNIPHIPFDLLPEVYYLNNTERFKKLKELELSVLLVK